VQSTNRPTKPALLPTHYLQGDAAHHRYPTFSTDGKLLACACEEWSEGSFHIWDINSRQRTTLTSGPGPDALAFSPGNERVAIAREKEIDVFALPSGQRLIQIPCERSKRDDSRLKLIFAGVDQLWVLQTLEGVWLWDLSNGRVKLHRQFVRPNWGCELTWLDGSLVLYMMFWDPEDKSAHSHHLRVEVLETGEVIQSTSPGTRPQFTPDLRHVMIRTDGGAGECEVWDLARGKRSGRVPASVNASLARRPLSPEGRYLAWPSPEENRINVWDTSQERLVQEIPTSGPYIPRSFSPTHWLLVAIANRLGRPADRQDRTIILDPLTGECLGEAALHPFWYEAEQAFSPCGRWFASGMSEECPHEMDDPVLAGTVLVTDLGSILSQASPVVRDRE
jgi:WD40 repeat protein